MKSSYIKTLILLLVVPSFAHAQSEQVPAESEASPLVDIDPSAEVLKFSHRKRIVPMEDENGDAISEDEHEHHDKRSNLKNKLFRGSHTAVNSADLESPVDQPSKRPVAQVITEMVSTSLSKEDDISANQSKIEQLYLRSLKIREKSLGPEHLDVATSLNNLADFYKENGQLGKARGLYQRALSIMEKNLGPDHPDVASTLENLANLYRRVSAVH